MNASVLHPPNSQLLGDAVISGMIQYTRRASSVYTEEEQTNRHEMQRHYGKGQVHGTPSTNWERRAPDTKKVAATEDHSATKCKRKRSETLTDSLSLSLQHPPRNPHEIQHAIGPMETGEEESEALQLHRTQRREIQRRYRAKQKKHLETLEKDTQQLRREIAGLEKHRRGNPTKGDIWSVAAQHFDLFRRGCQLKPRFSTMGAANSDSQITFVRSTMTPDAVLNGGYAAEAAVKSWCFSQWFDDFEVEPFGLERLENRSVTISTRTSVTITERTLRNVFPHLYSSNGSRHLRDKLLGQRIVMRGSTYFQWDTDSGRVVNVIAQSDMLTPMLHLLGSLEAVAFVFEKALVSPDFQWKAMSA